MAKAAHANAGQHWQVSDIKQEVLDFGAASEGSAKPAGEAGCLAAAAATQVAGCDRVAPSCHAGALSSLREMLSAPEHRRELHRKCWMAKPWAMRKLEAPDSSRSRSSVIRW